MKNIPGTTKLEEEFREAVRSTFEEEVASRDKALENCKDEVRWAHQAHERADSEWREAQDEESDYRDRISHIEYLSETYDDRVSAAQQQLRDAEDSYQQYRYDHQKWERERSDVQTTLDRLDFPVDHSGYEQKKAQYEAEQSSLDGQLSEYEDKQRTLDKALKKRQDDYDEARRNLDNQSREADDPSQEAELNAKRVKLESELHDAESAYDSAKRDAEDNARRLEDIRYKRKGLVEPSPDPAFERRVKEYEESKSAFESRRAEAERMLSELGSGDYERGKIDEANNLIEELRGEPAMRAEQEPEYRSRLAEIQRKLPSLENKAEDYSRINAAERAVKHAENDIVELKETIARTEDARWTEFRHSELCESGYMEELQTLTGRRQDLNQLWDDIAKAYTTEEDDRWYRLETPFDDDYKAVSDEYKKYSDTASELQTERQELADVLEECEICNPNEVLGDGELVFKQMLPSWEQVILRLLAWVAVIVGIINFIRSRLDGEFGDYSLDAIFNDFNNSFWGNLVLSPLYCLFIWVGFCSLASLLLIFISIFIDYMPAWERPREIEVPDDFRSAVENYRQRQFSNDDSRSELKPKVDSLAEQQTAWQNDRRREAGADLSTLQSARPFNDDADESVENFIDAVFNKYARQQDNSVERLDLDLFRAPASNSATESLAGVTRRWAEKITEDGMSSSLR